MKGKVQIIIGPPEPVVWDGENWEDWPVSCAGPGVSSEGRKIEHALDGPFAGMWSHEWSMGRTHPSFEACLRDYRALWEQHGWEVEFIVRP